MAIKTGVARKREVRFAVDGVENYEFLDRLRDQIAGIARKNRTFEVVAPTKLTVYDPGQARYSKRSYIGEEQLIVQDCYIGKRKQLIFTFEDTSQVAPAGGRVEISLNQAPAQLHRFRQWADELLHGDYEQVVRDARAYAMQDQEQVTQQRVKTIVEQNENLQHYGSW